MPRSPQRRHSKKAAKRSPRRKSSSRRKSSPRRKYKAVNERPITIHVIGLADWLQRKDQAPEGFYDRIDPPPNLLEWMEITDSKDTWELQKDELSKALQGTQTFDQRTMDGFNINYQRNFHVVANGKMYVPTPTRPIPTSDDITWVQNGLQATGYQLNKENSLIPYFLEMKAKIKETFPNAIFEFFNPLETTAQYKVNGSGQILDDLQYMDFSDDPALQKEFTDALGSNDNVNFSKWHPSSKSPDLVIDIAHAFQWENYSPVFVDPTTKKKYENFKVLRVGYFPTYYKKESLSQIKFLDQTLQTFTDRMKFHNIQKKINNPEYNEPVENLMNIVQTIKITRENVHLQETGKRLYEVSEFPENCQKHVVLKDVINSLWLDSEQWTAFLKTGTTS